MVAKTSGQRPENHLDLSIRNLSVLYRGEKQVWGYLKLALCRGSIMKFVSYAHINLFISTQKLKYTHVFTPFTDMRY